MNGAIPLTPLDLVVASGLVLVAGLVSTALRLGLGRRLGIASITALAVRRSFKKPFSEKGRKVTLSSVPSSRPAPYTRKSSSLKCLSIGTSGRVALLVW